MFLTIGPEFSNVPAFSLSVDSCPDAAGPAVDKTNITLVSMKNLNSNNSKGKHKKPPHMCMPWWKVTRVHLTFSVKVAPVLMHQEKFSLL